MMDLAGLLFFQGICLAGLLFPHELAARPAIVALTAGCWLLGLVPMPLFFFGPSWLRTIPFERMGSLWVASCLALILVGCGTATLELLGRRAGSVPIVTFLEVALLYKTWRALLDFQDIRAYWNPPTPEDVSG